MRNSRLTAARAAALSLLIGLPVGAYAQLEEIVVTAQRRETDLQETPISIQAFTAEDLELGGLTNGRDLGIMVPNVVLNPGVGGAQSSFYIRGLPGVGIYVDGVWQGGFGFQQTNFVEMERVEVLRGPQGTLFGRNTNGGAVNMITRRPGDEFGARVNLEAGEFNRRNMSLAVDLPISDTLKTKFMAASRRNDGFLQGLSVPWNFGSQDDTLFRADVLWEPSDNFSLRFTANDEQKAGTDPRIVRFTNLNHPRFTAYNVLAGNPDYMAAARAIDPAWPDPPKTLISDRFGPLTHEPGFPGGEVGKWQTKSDSMQDGITVDTRYYTMTMNWDITDNLSFESITSSWEQYGRQVVDFDGSEFIITTDDINDFSENFTQEFHLTGSNLDGRINWLAGYYSLNEDNKRRFYRWGLWEFAVPNQGPSDPPLDIPALLYVRNYGALVGTPGLANYFPIVLITDDYLSATEDEDRAFFGEVTFSLTDQLDMTLGIRVSDEQGRDLEWVTRNPVTNAVTGWNQTDAFRTDDPQVRPQGDMFAGVNPTIVDDPDLGNITTNKFALTYQANDDLMLYFSWGEGFTSGGLNFVNNVGLVTLDPEVISTTEIGLRSDWLDGKLRLNATYFDSEWEGMRVQKLPPDPNNPGASLPFPYPTSDGLGTADGLEVEMIYVPTDRLQLTLGMGLISTAYQERGAWDGVNGIAPNSPFAYAPDESATLGIQYDVPLDNGGHIMLVGNYGWRGEYVRDAAYQRTAIDGNGNPIFEPSYGILNARVVFEPADASWNLALWGTNLTDEQYINGGFDTRNVWGYDFSIVGRSREMGVSLGFTF